MPSHCPGIGIREDEGKTSGEDKDISQRRNHVNVVFVYSVPLKIN